jgi:hypothetical protein
MDIKKQLVLEVSVSTQKLKAELEGLKKDLGKALNQGGPTRAGGSQVDNELKKTKEINAAYKQRQREQDQIDKAYRQREQERTREASKADKQFDKIASKKAQVQKREEERIAKQTEKEIKQNETVLQKEEAAKIRAQQKQQQQAEKARKQETEREKQQINARYEFLKKRHLESQVEKSRLDRSFIAKAARGLGMSEEAARDLARKGEGISGIGRRGALGMLGRAGGLMALGGTMSGMANAYEDYRMLQASRRQEQVSNIMSGQFVTQSSRDYGRQFSGGHLLASGGGALMGAGAGAAAGAAVGSIVPVIGTLAGAIIGGIGGAVYKGIDSYMGFSEKRAARFQKETQPLQDATNRAMALNPARLDLLKRGASEPLLNLAERQGVGFGFSPEESIQQYQQLQGILGNEGAASTLNTARRLNLATGADIGTTGQMVQSLVGGNRQGYGANAMQTESIVSRAMANGLDRSKTSKFLQETSSVIQSATLFSKIDTEGVSNRYMQLAGAFGEGKIDETSMRQARAAMDLQQQGSFATQGMQGLGNYFSYQKIFGDTKMSGIDMRALMGLSQNATIEDAMKALSPETAAQPGMQDKVRQFLAAKPNTLQEAERVLGPQLARTVFAEEKGLATEQAIAFSERTKGGALKEGVPLSDEEVRKSQAFQMQQRQAQLDQEQINLGRTTFSTAIANTAKDLEKLQTAFSDAVKVFNDVLKDMNMQQIKYSPAYSGSGRGNGQ